MSLRKGLTLGVLVALVVCLVGVLGNDAQGQVKTPAAQTKKISIAAAVPGGSIYIAASAISKVLKEKLGLDALVEATGGTVHNYQLVNNGQAEIGFTLTIDSQDGWEGTGKWTGGKKMQNVRALTPLYPTMMQMIARPESKIQTANDVNGKRVWLSNAGSGHDSIWRLFFQDMGIKPSSIVNVAPTDGADMFRDGRVDAMGMISTVPASTFSELAKTSKVTVVSIPLDDIKKFMSKNSFAKPGKIRVGDYDTLTADLPTVVSWMSLVSHRSIPDELAYQITDAIFANHKDLVDAYSKLDDSKPEFVDQLNIPYHPGAVRYYREKGIKIPERLLP